MVLIGKDTRLSGYMFESVLEAGLSSAGVDVRLLGPMPTPAIAYLTRTLRANAGIVISASHNPFMDNGIKFFSSEGKKLPGDIERAIEAELEVPMVTVSSDQLGRAERVNDAGGRYIEYCKSTFPYRLSLRGIKIVVDCAHGATYHVAPNVFAELGADVVSMGCQPNGLNINAGCGAVEPQALAKEVIANRADLGIAFDGDGDRVIMVDRAGEIVDGDELLYIIAASRVDEGVLNGGVVGTAMSNLGLAEGLARLGLTLERANVGDRYVLELMHKHGYILGGEASGHLICLDRVTTGDGIVSALQVLIAITQGDKDLHELKQGMTKYPQVLRNVRLSEQRDVISEPAVIEAVKATESALGKDGRVLLRPSGTEPMLRVMVEGRDLPNVIALADHLAKTVESSLNS